MTQVLVTFASSHGATAEIGEVIGKVLRDNQLDVDVIRVEDVEKIDSYDVVVLGSAVYRGEWMKVIRDFLYENAHILKNQHIWLFSSGPTGEGNPVRLVDGVTIPESIQPLMKIVNPRDVAVFGGKIDLRRLKKDERVTVQEKEMEKGDFRNWHAVQFWAQQIVDALKTVALDDVADSALLDIKKKRRIEFS
jgi:menaquinone-dependent protoporphyrinogen oxidase